VTVTIKRLREKLEPDPDEPTLIITERGEGYRFRIPDNTLADGNPADARVVL